MIPPRFADTIRARCQALSPQPSDAQPQLRNLGAIRAVLFDVYGTLMISASGDIGSDSGDHRIDSLQETCSLFDFELPCSPSETLEAFEDAIRRDHAASKAHGIDYPEVDIAQIWKTTLKEVFGRVPPAVDFERFSFEFEIRANPVWPMPELASTLSTLKRDGLVLGIVSNAQFFTPIVLTALAGKSLEQLGFAADLTYFSYEYRQAKPGTFLYESARKQLSQYGIQPAEVLYVGNDMLNDVAAAATVGFRTALFAGDRRSLRWRDGDDRVRGIKPDIVVTGLGQLTDCLGVERDS